MTTRDKRTTEPGKMILLPAVPGTCVHCATEHNEHLPHNYFSLFYGIRFKMKWGRGPTHADCVAHLPEETQLRYREVLAGLGRKWTEPDGDPIQEPYAMSE